MDDQFLCQIKMCFISENRQPQRGHSFTTDNRSIILWLFSLTPERYAAMPVSTVVADLRNTHSKTDKKGYPVRAGNRLET